MVPTESFVELREIENNLKAELRVETLLVTKLRSEHFSQKLDQEINSPFYVNAVTTRNSLNSDERNEEDYTSYISMFSPAENIVNGFDYSVDEVQEMPNGTKTISFNGTSRNVTFFLKYNWNETTDKVSEIEVYLLNPLHQHELASHLNYCSRHDYLHGIVESIESYAELNWERETVLRSLQSKYEISFIYDQLDTAGCYKIDVKNPVTGMHYFEATWTIHWSRVVNHFTHSYVINTSDEGQKLADRQKALFIQLTSHGLTMEQIMETFSELLGAWNEE